MEKKRKMENVALHRKPHFFKVLLGDFACRLKLPPNFLKHISNESSENAILVGPNGCGWSVQIEKTLDGTYLSAGWSNFVKYHSLKAREFLVFQYNGKMQFSIQIFDTTACEREDLFDLPMYKEPNSGFENYEPKDMKKNINFCTHFSTGNAGIRIGNVKSEMGELPVNLNASESIRGAYASKICMFTTEKGSKACKAARSFRSDFPTTIVQITASKVRPGTMRLPTYFSRKHLPREKTNMSLRDPNENVWTVAYCPGNKDRRDKLGVGWTNLVHANNIDDGDYCVFELKAPNEMSVHIFRACGVVD